VFIVRSTRRLAVLVLGCAVTAAGLVMIVTPGPGLVVIIAGLAILATEFTWAEILLDRAKKQAIKAKDAAVRKAGGLRRRRTLRLRVTEVTQVTELTEYGPPAPQDRVPARVETLTVVELTESIAAADTTSATDAATHDDHQGADGNSMH
jgi:uncharacterized protein (TIGR02611 family)